MWLVRLALRAPYTFVVLALAIVLLGAVAIVRAPKDVFPEISEPIVTLIWQYVGIPADAFEKQITIFSEQQINTTVSNVRRIESNTIYGKNRHPHFLSAERAHRPGGVADHRDLSDHHPAHAAGTDAAADRAVRRLQRADPADCVGQRHDVRAGALRPGPVAGAQRSRAGARGDGAAAVRRPPALDRDRSRSVRMQAKGVTAKEVNDALNRQNVNLPTGSTQIGDREYVLAINNSPEKIELIGEMPIKNAGRHDGLHPRRGATCATATTSRPAWCATTAASPL